MRSSRYAIDNIVVIAIKAVRMCIATCFMYSVTASAGFCADEKTGIAGEFGRIAGHLTSESSDIITTPFSSKDGNIFVTLGIAGAIGLTYSFDEDIRANVHKSDSRTTSKAADIVSIAGDPFLHLGAAALVYGYGVADDSAQWKSRGEMLGEALILADATTLIIKQAAGRGRPHVAQKSTDFKPFGFKSDYDSFPSMHTASSFALASVMASTSESMISRIGYYSAATLVGASRLYKNKHWASDVLLGAAIGELCGRVVTNYHANKASTRIVPYAGTSNAGILLVKSW